MLRAIVFLSVMTCLLGGVAYADPIHDAVAAGDLEKVKAIVKENPAALNAVNGKEKHLPLHVAAEKGQVEVARWLIAQGIPVDCLTSEKETPLHVACWAGQVKTAEVLLEAGAKVTARAQAQATPLIYAGGGGNIELFDLLIKHGAKLDEQGEGGATALHYAASAGRVNTIEFLLAKGFNVKATGFKFKASPLSLATNSGKLDAVKALLKAGADPEQKQGNFESPLCHAASGGHVEILKALLDAGGRVEHRDGTWSDTPIFFATKSKHIDCVKLLLDRGADPNARQYYYIGRAQKDVTALHAAAAADAHEIAKLLVSRGGDPLLKSALGETPIDWGRKYSPMVRSIYEEAAKNPDPNWPSQKAVDVSDSLLDAASDGDVNRIRKILGKSKSQLDGRGQSANTPLCLAAANGSLAAVKALIDAGGMLDARNAQLQTPLHLAIQSGKADVVNALLAANAYVNPRDQDMNTPLHLAAAAGKKEMVAALFTAGATRDARNKEGQIAADMAKGDAAGMFNANRKP